MVTRLVLAVPALIAVTWVGTAVGAGGEPKTPTVLSGNQLAHARQARMQQWIAQIEWLRTQTPFINVSKVVDGQTLSVITYPSALKKGLTCVEMRLGITTSGSGCIPTRNLFTSRPLLVNYGQYNGGVDLGLTYLWGYASAQVKTITIRTVSGRTIAVPVVNGAFLYAGTSGAAPAAVFAKNGDGRTVESEAAPDFSQALKVVQSHSAGA